jgi:diaminohydroxyphosphoribosylaminopyrimidine deaminase/5-amino-6-(5-phosphoribosylamino)uracil reductase
VGAVVVNAGRIVGRGWHKQYGGPHAEVFALEEAGELARGAALYATLEPCNHTGKTPPCVQAILAAGIKKIVLGARDPNPVAAGGAAALIAAGVEVVDGVFDAECRALNAPFFKTVQTGLPLISLKWAMSLDGKIAASGGDSKWITSDESRAAAHRLRARHDAVLIGIGTLLADGSQLTCRTPPAGSETSRQPQRIVLDSSARTPLDAPIWDAPGGGPVTIVCAASTPHERVDALRARGARIVEAPGDCAGLDVRETLKALAKLRIQSILVEGGGRVLGSFVDARVADRAFIFIAPKIIGGAGGLAAVAGRGVARVADALRLRKLHVTPIGADVLVDGALSEWEWDDAMPT